MIRWVLSATQGVVRCVRVLARPFAQWLGLRLVQQRAIALICAAGVGLSGCGGSGSAGEPTKRPTSNQTASQPSGGKTADTYDGREVGKSVLDRWSDELLSNLLLQRDRARASAAGNTAKAGRLERKARPGLRRIQRFGREARAQFLQHLDSPEARAVRKAGDAWTRWAYTILTQPPAGDFKKATRIADLGAAAVAAHQRAYRALGEPVPPAFRTR